MSRRKTFQVQGVEHGAPIPLAAQVGNIIWSSAMMGVDASTGTLPEDGTSQVEHLFANTEALLREAQISPDDIVYVSVLLADNGLREEINRHWLRWFPEPIDRPARHTTVHALPGRMLAQLQFMAVKP